MNFQVNALPQPLAVVLQIIATIILFFILRHFLFEPVSKFLRERREKIEGDLNEAKENKRKAAELKEQYEAKLQEARKEAQEIVESGRKRGDQMREEIVSEAKKEAKNIVSKAKTEIEREREKAMQNLKQEVVTIAMMAASKVIDKNLDEDVHKDIINEFIDKVGENKWQN